MTGRRPALAVGAVLLAVLMAVGVSRDDRAPVVAAAQPAVRARVSPPAPQAAGIGMAWKAARPGAGPARPASLDGTEVDGSLAVDSGGRLIASSEVIRLFDYFLAAAGEDGASDAELRALIAAEAGRRVPGHEAAVLELLDRYLQYRIDAHDAAAAAPAGTGPRQHLDRLLAIQRDTFGDDADRLFGDDTAIAIAVLDRSDVMNGGLAPADRDAALAAIEARMPAPLRQARARMRAPVEVGAAVAAIRDGGGSEAEVRALRAAHFGEAAADRLAELDRRRAGR